MRLQVVGSYSLLKRAFTSTMHDLHQDTVLVTGGAGFIGSHIVDQLLEEPVDQVVVLDNFIRGTRTNLREAKQDDRAARPTS